MNSRRFVTHVLTFLAGALVVVLYFTAMKFLPAPPSSYSSEESIQARKKTEQSMKPYLMDILFGDEGEKQSVLDKHFWAPKIEEALRLYPVIETSLEIDGIYVEAFEPVGGIPGKNQGRLLINLHAGGFMSGARTSSRLESIPVAHMAGMRVVSVDYRQGPDHRFPAASEDIATVYRHFLKSYKAEKIGIFGCSAGGLLTAQAVAWFDANDLPQPGAVGIFCAGIGGEFNKGDSISIANSMGARYDGGKKIDYFENTDWKSPLAAPANYPELLSRFPPSLIITSTRDQALSGAIIAHQRLRAAGAQSDLFVFEGLPHFFFTETSTPESRRVFEITAEFFDKHLEQ